MCILQTELTDGNLRKDDDMEGSLADRLPLLEDCKYCFGVKMYASCFLTCYFQSLMAVEIIVSEWESAYLGECEQYSLQSTQKILTNPDTMETWPQERMWGEIWNSQHEIVIVAAENVQNKYVKILKEIKYSNLNDLLKM